MAFRNEITAGTTLIREAIQSQDYDPGDAGWTINADGSAEFNNVTIRGGTVVGGVALYYDGTPALGNLIMSIAASAGADDFGNAYVAGVGVYGTSNTVTVKNDAGDMVRLRVDAPSGLSDTTAPGLELRKSTDTGDGASITEYDDTFSRGMLLLSPSPVVGGSLGEDFAGIQLDGRFATDPIINMYATGPDSHVAINSTVFNWEGEVLSYPGPHSFTPSLGNGGSAAYSQRVGWYYKLGPMVFFNAYFVVSTAGSGVNPLTLHGPTNVDRTHRQSVWGYAEGLTAGNNGVHNVVGFQSGSAQVWDRVRTYTGANIAGADLLVGAVLTYQGWYREEV
jgi:hypothetical protein